jgi:hypothetical protein
VRAVPVRTKGKRHLAIYGTSRKALDDVTKLMQEGCDLHAHKIRRPTREETLTLIEEARSNLAAIADLDDEDWEDDDWED